MIFAALRLLAPAIVLLAAASVVQAAALATSFKPVSEPMSAPHLPLADLQGETVAVADFAGKVVVLNFWATWCPPCREEMPSLQRLHETADGEDIVVLAANVGEQADTVRGFAESLDPRPTFPLLVGTPFEKLGEWKVRGLPTTVVIARDGSLAYRAEGGLAFDHPDVMQQLQDLAATGRQ
jgi:thiol-disulfide isomerase/thioredoxin